MVGSKYLLSWLAAANVTRIRASCYSLLAVMTPSLIGASVQGVVTEVSLMLCIPFVLFSAIILGWRYAVLVALASALVFNFWFIQPLHQIHVGPTGVFSLTSFLIVSAMLIAFVEAVRQLVQVSTQSARLQSVKPGGIIFSLEAGMAWASWYEAGEPVCLGPADEVAFMMEDFLAQLQLGRRLLASLP